jgi:hypothetical protein
MVVYLCVLIVFSLHRESLKLILVDEPLPEVVLSQALVCRIMGCDHSLGHKEFLDQFNLLYIWICLLLQQIKSYRHMS